MGEILARVEIRDPFRTPIYQAIAAEAAEMHARGVRVRTIARHFGVDRHTADKALRWSQSR